MKTEIKPDWFDIPNIRTLIKGDLFKLHWSTKEWLFIGYDRFTKGYKYCSPDNPKVIGILKKTHKESIILK
jgi:hypothetical protein